jgi:hypothetical protein
MLRRRTATVAVLAAAVVALPGAADAKWSATGAGSPVVGAATMRNASGPTSTCFNFSGSQRIAASWTASPDTWVVSYLVKRTGNAPGANATLAPVTYGTNFLLDTPPRTNVGDSYTYTIQSVRNNWITSTITTPTRTYTTAGAACT